MQLKFLNQDISIILSLETKKLNEEDMMQLHQYHVIKYSGGASRMLSTQMFPEYQCKF